MKQTVFQISFQPPPAPTPSPSSLLLVRSDGVVSTLSIEHAGGAHSGNYTCAPSNARPDSVLVHVVDGEIMTVFLNVV